jgi:uncharacterized lipoprotein YajG
MPCLKFTPSVKYLLPAVVFLTACAAPPTQEQVTSRAVNRNCEAQGALAASEVWKQSAQIVKEGAVTNEGKQGSIEARAAKAREAAYKKCMFEYSV